MASAGDYTTENGTLVEIAISASDTAATIATATASALNALTGITAVSSTPGEVLITGISNANKPFDAANTGFGILSTETPVGSEFLQTDASGNIKFGAAPGGGGVVTSLTTTGSGGAATLNEAGVLNIPSYLSGMSQNIEAYGSIAAGTEFGLGNAQYNSEHKFVVNLGSPTITTISPKNMVSCSVWTNPTVGILKGWNGWVWGTGGTIRLSLYRAILQCPIEGEYPATVPVCQTSFQTIILAGNTTPLCWTQADFNTCDGFTENLGVNEVLIITANVVDGEECDFALSTNILLKTV